MISYCVFNVGQRRIGLPLEHVREIIDQQHIVPTPIPLTPAFMRGLFNLRGQVLPYLDLAPFVGATAPVAAPSPADRAVIVERGPFRFATPARRIDTVEADPATFTAPAQAALYPALDAEAQTDDGQFEILHLDRLEACLSQAMKRIETTAIATVANDNAATDNKANANDTQVNAVGKMTKVETRSQQAEDGSQTTDGGSLAPRGHPTP